MITDDVSDSRARTMVQRYIATKSSAKYTLRGLMLCGSQKTNMAQYVELRTNGEKSMFSGTTFCHSAWACPYCTARVMAMKGTDIGAAIDALSTWYHQDAFMITFTMPHTQKMSCEFAFSLLKDAWRRFSRAGNKRGRLHKDRNTIRGNDAYGDFRESLGIVHNIKVYEFTWGEEFNWHPHLHVLYWVPHKNFSSVLSYEDRLLDRWWTCLKQAMFAQLKERYALINKEINDEEIKQKVEEYYTEWRKHPVTGHKAVYMSKNKDGSLRKTSSARYISGWGGDFEVSNQKTKIAADGHYSINQIIQNACENESARKKWLDLYLEYATTTRGSRRVEFSSRSGITEIIRKWKASNDYVQVLKKKIMGKEEDWYVVCSFTKQQWNEICAEDLYGKIYLKSTLLHLAREPNAGMLIENLLKYCHINYSWQEDLERNIAKAISTVG